MSSSSTNNRPPIPELGEKPSVQELAAHFRAVISRKFPHYGDMNKSINPLYECIVGGKNLDEVEELYSLGLVEDLLMAATYTCVECKKYNSYEYDQVLQRIDSILSAIKPELYKLYSENNDVQDLMDDLWYTYEEGAEVVFKREHHATMNEAGDFISELEETEEAEYNNQMILEYKHFRKFLKQYPCFNGVHSLFLKDLENQMKDGEFPSCRLGYYDDD